MNTVLANRRRCNFDCKLSKLTMEVISAETLPVILVKLSTSPLLPQQCWILSKNAWKWVLSVGAPFYRESGREEGKNTRLTKELLLGAQFYVTITWKNFTTFPKFFDLHCSLTLASGVRVESRILSVLYITSFQAVTLQGGFTPLQDGMKWMVD